ncbi:hypothetical protein M5K25_010525 [Dendrobium thyrsiflorum]|uniref:Uncharacterized protein n=1 Tax=Dendrobium thyrsiflorum TaxID=117978 RepID=A0ABD0V7D1_DENTH
MSTLVSLLSIECSDVEVRDLRDLNRDLCRVFDTVEASGISAGFAECWRLFDKIRGGVLARLRSLNGVKSLRMNFGP